MNFIDRLASNKGNMEIKLNEIIKFNKPIYIYGFSDMAKLIFQIFSEELNKHGIIIEGFIVDDEYFKDKLIYENKPVYRFSDIVKSKSEICILMGFSSGIALKKELEIMSINKKNKMIYYDPSFIYFNSESCDYNWIKNNNDFFNETYNILEDEVSKLTLINLFNQYLTGDIYLKDFFNEYNQYYPEMINFKDEIYVDCGAYIGDTILELMNKFSGYKKIYTFEPNVENFRIMKKNINKYKNIKLINKGTWSKKTILNFANTGVSVSSHIVENCNVEENKQDVIKISVDSIDNILNGEEVTFIKMDVEGSELESLIGAKKSIIKYKPKLAISVYHKKNDLITIPQYIKSLNKDYKLYIRAHKLYANEVILYAI